MGISIVAVDLGGAGVIRQRRFAITQRLVRLTAPTVTERQVGIQADILSEILYRAPVVFFL
jgi:hypothetical protein